MKLCGLKANFKFRILNIIGMEYLPVNRKYGSVWRQCEWTLLPVLVSQRSRGNKPPLVPMLYRYTCTFANIDQSVSNSHCVFISA
jgi:hypothetical protein